METLEMFKVSLVLLWLKQIEMDETKMFIISEAEKLFMKYGIRSVTMDDIAKSLGISKKTIYINFRDKNELVTELFQSFMVGNEGQIQKCTIKSLNAIDEVFQITQHLKETLSVINPIVFYDLEKYHNKVFQIIDDHKKKFLYNKIINNLERGIKEGYYRENIEKDIIAKTRIQQLNWVFESASQSHYGLYELLIETTYFYLFGISTPKGWELINRNKNIEKQ